MPCSLPALLQCAMATQVAADLRIAASIQLKNVIAKHWKHNVGEGADASSRIDRIIFSDHDKSIIRENIIEASIVSPQHIKAQMAETVKHLIERDYPHNWPNLIALIGNNIGSDDNMRVLGAMTALRNLARKYEFKDEAGREPINAIVQQTFPTLLRMMHTVVQSGTEAVEAAEILKLICKTFWSATYLSLPVPMREYEFFGKWMEGFYAIISQPVPSAGEPQDHFERQNWPWWKCKKWAIHIFNRLFDRYGDPSVLAGNDKLFAGNFKAHYPVKFLDAYFNLLSIIGRGGYLPDRVVNLCMTFLSNALAKKNTYKRMRDHVQPLLSQIVFPVLCFNDHDAELWEDDPHEYIRKGYDIIEDLYSPRTAAVNFMLEMARLRAKDNNNLDLFLGFVVAELTAYNEASAADKQYRRKDGAMLAVGSLSDKLKSSTRYAQQLEPMILHHVLPEFQSPHGHLRAKAAWVCGQYADIEFSQGNLFQQLFERVLMGIKDVDLPVRVDSVVALKEFVLASQDLDELRAILPQLLSEFFRLINEVDNEDLVLTLETIVDKFGEEIAPYAKSLCENLAAAFWKCIQSADGEDDDESGALASVGCLRAICTILESVSNLPQMLATLEPILYPIMQKMLSTDGQDIFEEVLEMMSYVTYFSTTISPMMWTLYPQMCKELDDWAVDYFENILVPMDNFVSRGTEVFIASRDPNYLAITFHVTSRVIGNDQNSEENMKPGALIFSCVLQNCRGHVDEYVEKFLAVCWQRLTKGVKSRRLKETLVLVFMDALYYNPVLTLQILHRHNLLNLVFSMIFAMITEQKHFRYESQKKICAMGLSSILAQPVSSLPEEVVSGLGTLFTCVIDCLTRLHEQIKAREEEEAAEDSDGEDGENDEGDDDDEDEDEEIGLDDENDDEGLRDIFTPKQAREIRLMAFSNDDDDDSDYDYYGEDDEFQSPVDDIDPFIFFTDAMVRTTAAILPS